MTDTSFYSICVVIVDSTFYSIFLVEPTRLFLQCKISSLFSFEKNSSLKGSCVSLKLSVDVT